MTGHERVGPEDQSRPQTKQQTVRTKRKGNPTDPESRRQHYPVEFGDRTEPVRMKPDELAFIPARVKRQTGNPHNASKPGRPIGAAFTPSACSNQYGSMEVEMSNQNDFAYAKQFDGNLSADSQPVPVKVTTRLRVMN